jgi:hypothetical protein
MHAVTQHLCTLGCRYGWLCYRVTLCAEETGESSIGAAGKSAAGQAAVLQGVSAAGHQLACCGMLSEPPDSRPPGVPAPASHSTQQHCQAAADMPGT